MKVNFLLYSSREELERRILTFEFQRLSKLLQDKKMTQAEINEIVRQMGKRRRLGSYVVTRWLSVFSAIDNILVLLISIRAVLRLDAKESSTSHDERERNVRKRDVNEEKKKTRTKPALLWDLDENLIFFFIF